MSTSNPLRLRPERITPVLESFHHFFYQLISVSLSLSSEVSNRIRESHDTFRAKPIDYQVSISTPIFPNLHARNVGVLT